MTLRNVERRADGWRRENERRLADTRLIIYYMITGNPHIKSEAKPKKVSDVFPLPSDPEPEKLTEDKVQSDLELVSKFKDSKLYKA